MTYREALEKGKAYLAEHHIPEAGTDAWYLMEFGCRMTRTRYLMRMQEEMPQEEADRYQELIARRGEHIPLQHITGEQEFMGFSFLVSDKVLVPRQDTEILVEEALRKAKPGMRVLDLCTGSGCIIISLKKLCPEIEGTASDYSPEALRVARENAKRQNTPVTFIESDLFEKIDARFDLIVSNPPYIPTAAIDGLMEEVRLHDPFMALDGREDGLYFYRKIVEESSRYLSMGGWLMFEIGSEQGEDVSGMMRDAGYTQIKVIKDLAGLDRVVAGQLKTFADLCRDNTSITCKYNRRNEHV